MQNRSLGRQIRSGLGAAGATLAWDRFDRRLQGHECRRGRVGFLRDHHVRGDSSLADGRPTGRIKPAYGQPQSTDPSLAGEYPLDAPFPVGDLTDDVTSIVISNRTCEDLAGTCALCIDQDDQWHIPSPCGMGGVVSVFRGVPTACRDNPTSHDEVVGKLDGRLEEPSGISPQVDDQGLHSLARKVKQSAADLVDRGLLKVGDPDVADLSVSHFSRRDTGNFDASSDHVDRDALVTAR